MKKWAQFTLLISGFCFWAVLPAGVAAFTDPIDEYQYTGLIRIACCGDSITYGTGIPDRATNSYPAQLQALLGSNYDVRNFGRSGARVTQSSSNPYKSSAEYNAAIAFDPHIVIICLGINDCTVSQWPGNKPHFVNDYKDLISDFKALTPTPPVKIWLGTLMLVVPPYEPYIGIQGTIAECDPLIEQVATDEGLTLVDLFTRLNMEQNYYSTDGIHPSKEGAAIISDLVQHAITGNYGGLQMPYVFGDHMVLQRNKPIPIFGIADTNESITVTLDTNIEVTTTDYNGQWRVDIPAMTEGGPHTLTVASDTTLTFTDVLIGEVWVAAGQSNMAWQFNQDADWATQGPLANNYPNIRLLNRVGDPWPSGGDFTQAELDKTTIDDYYTGSWQVCSQSTAGLLSAVAYYFSRDIHVATSVPVGIIENAVGGTSMEAYMPREALATSDLYLLTKDWLNASLAPDWHRGRATDNLGLWLNGPQTDSMPHHPFEPTFLYHADISDLMPFAIRGTLWYQGETNATDSSSQIAWDQEHNRRLFEGLISGWRDKWGQGDFPFYYVQLPNLNRNWMLFREMQFQTLSALTNLGMAVTIDIGNPTNVHPTAKQEVGRRLSLWARAKDYGETSLVHSGPLYNDSFTDEGSTLRVGFDHVGGGLQALGGGALTGFEVVGEDGNWQAANAIIQDSEIVVSSASVPDPQAVRYAWASNPVMNLINAEGLPASPFRAGDLNFTPTSMTSKPSSEFPHFYEANGYLPNAETGQTWMHAFGTGTFTAEPNTNDNSDRQHVFRVAYEGVNYKYHVWRDGVKIGIYLGAALTGFSQNWMIVIDSGSNVSSAGEMDYICWDATGAYAQPKCDTTYKADFNKDCYVDLLDLIFFVSQWLDCTDPYYSEKCSKYVINPGFYT